jgi:hypothetical protein
MVLNNISGKKITGGFLKDTRFFLREGFCCFRLRLGVSKKNCLNTCLPCVQKKLLQVSAEAF